MQFVKMDSRWDIYNLLIEFQEVFPHLKDKISSLEDYAEKLSDLAYVYSAKQDNKSVGILVFYANDKKNKTAYISLIGVKREYEGKGKGKELLEHCEEISSKLGMSRIKLEVDCDNLNAKRFYRKNGFKLLGATKKNSLYMQKNI